MTDIFPPLLEDGELVQTFFSDFLKFKQDTFSREKIMIL